VSDSKAERDADARFIADEIKNRPDASLADRCRELVQRWKLRSNELDALRNRSDHGRGQEYALDCCIDELEAILGGPRWRLTMLTKTEQQTLADIREDLRDAEQLSQDPMLTCEQARAMVEAVERLQVELAEAKRIVDYWTMPRTRNKGDVWEQLEAAKVELADARSERVVLARAEEILRAIDVREIELWRPGTSYRADNGEAFDVTVERRGDRDGAVYAISVAEAVAKLKGGK
jgi:hypothetical protein